MRRLITALLVLLLAVWIGVQIAEDPGYVLIAAHHWTAEMPLWFFLLVIVLVFWIGHLLWRFSAGASNLVEHWRIWLRWRRRHQATSKTNRGLVELIEGHWKTAEHYLLDGVARSDAPLINYLAAAKAAHEQSAYDRRDQYLRTAHNFAPQAEVAIGLTQAQLQLSQGQLEQALATLGQLRVVAPQHGSVLQLLQRLYVRLADWNNLLHLIPNLQKAKIISSQQAAELEQKLYTELLTAAANKHDGLPAMRELWQRLPKKMRQQADVIYLYTSKLLKYSDTEVEAEKILREYLKKSWDERLVKLYGEINNIPDSNEQLAVAESWLKQYGEQSSLLLTLGRLCMRCQLWGKAKHYLEMCLQRNAQPEVYAEYGALLEQMGEIAAAAQHYRQGLLAAVSDKSFLPQRAD